jgi:hypothetical protein
MFESSMIICLVSQSGLGEPSDSVAVASIILKRKDESQEIVDHESSPAFLL